MAPRNSAAPSMNPPINSPLDISVQYSQLMSTHNNF